MEIRLRTLTPLWTGGIQGGCDRLHEMEIIGSYTDTPRSPSCRSLATCPSG